MEKDAEALSKAIFQISSEDDFVNLALRVFRYQVKHCDIYNKFVQALGIDPAAVNSLEQIPFMPISFFKTHKVYSDTEGEEIVFSSSGTTGMELSKHYVAKADLYRTSFLKCFEDFYGAPHDFCILALLPGYLERGGSSLIYMVKELVRLSEHPDSGFYLYDHERLHETLIRLEERSQKTLLIGVSFALLDFFEKYRMKLRTTVILETGGMKGRKKEIIREELHEILKAGSGVKSIHSEYGMTELLSQAYSQGDGKFICPPWMHLLIREATDPFSYVPDGRTGGINVIDLANIYSCSFIATQDLGRKTESGTEILGRFDNSDIRGCSLMV